MKYPWALREDDCPILLRFSEEEVLGLVPLQGSLCVSHAHPFMSIQCRRQAMGLSMFRMSLGLEY